ncbi:MAG: uracil-DNA glycosylase [Candidatus Omnitrophica bacterium]|nr:uracil-DNA glycosylase [Candidatus Omnitrophota bacterium]
MRPDIDKFIQRLQNFPRPLRERAFNPWKNFDEFNDTSKRSPAVRRRQLGEYLRLRIGKARFCIIGEAVGYQGGHFSGIPMTSERILLGYHKADGIDPEDILGGMEPRQTSRKELKPKGFSEPTATIVWRELASSGFSAFSFVLWNAFAWHPYHPERGLLSNRTPGKKELDESMPVLECFLKMFPEAEIISLGRSARSQMDKTAREHTSLRHPAQGGAGVFRREFRKVLSSA